MTREEVIQRLRFKAENIKAKLEPSYFSECADYIDSLKCENCENWHDVGNGRVGGCEEFSMPDIGYTRHMLSSDYCSRWEQRGAE